MLSDFSNWLFGLVHDAVLAVLHMLQDAFLWLLNALLSGIAAILGAIPAPFSEQYSLSNLFAGLDPSIAYFVGQFGIVECLALLGAGVAFRLLRKLVTLGQW